MAKIAGICISEKKGTQKHEVKRRSLFQIMELKMMLMQASGIDRSACST